MKKFKQIIAVVLSLIMLISVLGAFQGSSEEVKAAQTQGYLIDFAQYSGGNATPGARLTAGNLKIGSEYTFSFSYYVDGVSTGFSCSFSLNSIHLDQLLADQLGHIFLDAS